MDLLLDRPALLDRLGAEPTALPRAIEEMLRFETPVIQFRRTATQDTTLGERPIREGERVVVFFPSANHDEAVFPDPMRFDATRTPNRHIAFGIGTHVCIGQSLARLQARITLDALAALPPFTTAAPPTWARWTEYGITRLPLRWA
jgi:cytochrome P450